MNEKNKDYIFDSAEWDFSKIDVNNFDSHIERSIPKYNDCHNLAVKISDFFLEDNSFVIDIGSTTGKFLNKLCERHHKKNKLNVQSIEIEKRFCEYSEKLFLGNPYSNFHQIETINADINEFIFPLESVDFITSFFTLQFIKPSRRAKLIRKIYESLNWGGAFIFFEKIRGADARFQDIFTYLLNQYKLDKNFTHQEILSKSLSLTGRMEPFSDYGNRQILEKGGFSDIEVIFRFINFQGYLCIK